MSEFKGTPWLVEIIEPDYLDGILSGVTVYGNERRPVAYAFDEAEGRVLAASPELLEAAQALVKADDARSDVQALYERACELARSAIVKALGEGR